MKRRTVFAILGLLALAFGYVLYLRFGNEEPPPLAKLVETRGEAVERDFAAAPEAWGRTEPGARFEAGDGLRTGAETTAILTLFDRSELVVQPDTTLRFSLEGDAASSGFGVDVQSGEALLRTRDSDLSLHSHVGSFLVKAGSAVMLRRDGDHMAFAVQMGSLEFRDANGDRHVLESGRDVHLSIGMAVLETPDAREQESAVRLLVQTPGASLRGRGEATFHDVEPGTVDVGPGTELSLKANATARVTRGSEHAELRGAGDFVLDSDDSLVVAQSGELSVESGQRDVRVTVPGGVIVVRKVPGGSRAKVAIGAGRGSLSVERGSVSASVGGETQELGAGDTHGWSTEAADASAEADGKPTLAAPDYFNIASKAGESFVLHAPELPVSVALDFSSRCPGEGEVQLSGTRLGTRGNQRVNVLFGKGIRSYSVRCVGANGRLGRIVARGTVHALLDAGTRKLPPLPPTSIAEADGRTYTLYYSNQPPALNIRWPNPPAAGSYTLNVDGKPLTVPSPEHTFKSGSLSDGTHRISFAAGSRQSRTTTVEVRFDNRAPTASVSQPADRSFSAGDEVKIEGVSLQGWKVSLEGGTITKGQDGRFSGSIVARPGNPDIAVRLSHPRRGVHYYLRRAASSQ